HDLFGSSRITVPRPGAGLAPEKAPEARAAERPPNELVLRPPRDPLWVSRREGVDIVRDPRAAVEAPDESAHVIRNEVRSTPAPPHVGAEQKRMMRPPSQRLRSPREPLLRQRSAVRVSWCLSSLRSTVIDRAQ